MTLEEICESIVDVEEGLMLGTISFSYDNLMSAMKPGHPMEILDSILAQIYFDAINGKEPNLKTVKKVYDELTEFKSCFKVRKLAKPIKELAEYIKQRENEIQE